MNLNIFKKPLFFGIGKRHQKISIVSAVYGVVDYIDEFVESIVQQSYDFTSNIELILVDDCSNDGSYDKCADWAFLYPDNIKVIKLQTNQGQGSARNHGLQSASNEWIIFADPDDMFHKNFFKHMMNAIHQQPNCDMFIGQFRSFYDIDNKEINDHPLGWRFKRGTCLTNVISDPRNIHFTVNNALIKKSLILENELNFDSRVKPAFEDALFINQYTLRSKSFQRCFCSKCKILI